MVEVKKFTIDNDYFILCIEETTNLTVNLKNRLFCLEKIVDTLNEGVMMSDHEGKIILYNDAQEKLEGLESREIIGKHLWSVYNYNPQYSEHKHTFKTGKPIFSRYRAHSTINGVPKYVNYSTFPIKKDGEMIAVFSLSTNESNLKDRLHQTIELKRQVVHSESKIVPIKMAPLLPLIILKAKALL